MNSFLISLILGLCIFLFFIKEEPRVVYTKVTCDNGFSTPNKARSPSMSGETRTIYWYDEIGLKKYYVPEGVICGYE